MMFPWKNNLFQIGSLNGCGVVWWWKLVFSYSKTSPVFNGRILRRLYIARWIPTWKKVCTYSSGLDTRSTCKFADWKCESKGSNHVHLSEGDGVSPTKIWMPARSKRKKGDPTTDKYYTRTNTWSIDDTIANQHFAVRGSWENATRVQVPSAKEPAHVSGLISQVTNSSFQCPIVSHKFQVSDPTPIRPWTLRNVPLTKSPATLPFNFHAMSVLALVQDTISFLWQLPDPTTDRFYETNDMAVMTARKTFLKILTVIHLNVLCQRHHHRDAEFDSTKR